MSPGLVVVLLAVVVVIGVLMSVKVVPVASCLVVERGGRYRTTLQPGLNTVVPLLDRVVARFDMREQVLSMREPLVCRDHYLCEAGLNVYLEFEDPSIAYRVDKPQQQLESAVRAALRELAGIVDRDELLGSAGRLTDVAYDATRRSREDWGIRVKRIELTDLSGPDVRP
ncbi:SPFH domain/Band 7 family protein [Nocardioides albertanoniae]|uniref:SPFH domain/Band 7 family protein n=1 Tax=Nocardioides albertanoniae TaxID=1175486 RepID=A0A543ABA9_9ACTN|nr:SPFH domain-containing protein [Nocardioides albertanoniae]TQL69839.1 SPFH domain/Band 7 family protein [Nocardioides albertanoniae]